jgi:Gig2-like
VWWHRDIIHAVEDHHKSTGYSNVIYIGTAPYCAKNFPVFEIGSSAPVAGGCARLCRRAGDRAPWVRDA